MVSRGYAAELPHPPAPETCCRSGCANCVYLKYALELEDYFRDGGLEAVNEIDKLVDDASLRAYLKMELKSHQRKPDKEK